MKRIITIISTLVLFLSASQISTGQINRTLETKVADILAQLPTKDLNHLDKLMREMVNLDVDGVQKFANMLVPLGSGDDTQARYAMQSVAVYSGGHPDVDTNHVVEQVLLNTLKNTSNDELSAFLIERLNFCGTNTSLPILQTYLSHKTLHKQALSALQAIGTDAAAKVIFEGLKITDKEMKPAFIDALGQLHYEPSVELLYELGSSNFNPIKQSALMAIANFGLIDSSGYLIAAAKNSNYNLDESKAILALIMYGNILQKQGNTKLSSEIGYLLLENCTDNNQLPFRTSGMYLIAEGSNEDTFKFLSKELKKGDLAYKAAVINAASKQLTTENRVNWIKAFKKSSPEEQVLIIDMLKSNKSESVFNNVLLKAINSKNEAVKIAGIKALDYQDKQKGLPVLLTQLNNAQSEAELQAIEETLLRVVSLDDSDVLASKLDMVNSKSKAVLVRLLAARHANNQFHTVVTYLETLDADLKKTIYASIPFMVSKDNINELIDLLSNENDDENIKNLQVAITGVLDSEDNTQAELIYKAFEADNDKSKWIPLLSELGSSNALQLVSNELKSGDQATKLLAIETLSEWKNNDALPVLFDVVTNDSELKQNAFKGYLRKVNVSGYPDDQKLLLVRKLAEYAKSTDEKKQIISEASNIKTFLSLVFVSEFLDNQNLVAHASNAVIKIALPTPGKNDALSGVVVKDIVSRSVDNLTGPDSQYIKLDVKEFLEKMPQDKGYVSIFNGKDLSGWEGLVQNPIARGKMTKAQLAKAQSVANTQMLKDWFVKDGVIGFKGEGYNNICTIKDYGDFEMLVDWKITNGGDSGIYLRGTPQVQIWDIARTNVGAQVGSGGLYNNQVYQSKPLVVADNPINDWNTFRIKMVGDRVTVYLNGVLVTDNVPLENYWDRNMDIFPKEAIELQAHGEDLGFRNIYVREIISGDDLLSKTEQQEGFKSLFNGKDLDRWIGNKVDYVVENNEIAVRPKQGGHGNLFTAEEYSDFVFRFEFKLTPGANNGLGIHAPLEGDAAYVGKELQILDDTASIYANLEPYQYHGSVYGIIAAKRGFLNPVGEWNYEEVEVKGDHIKITLNGTVIVDGNVKEASKNGTADHKDHPGLQRQKGHIGFLGHGSELWFRNIRIKDLSK
ncbi:DUF1080 domain-containing protein [Aestuariibaculum suncheonense]|uniref:DUF1080 domain-containing protein n=1 Tax=Aestuariibaculum suncheonense TaxID=1028745 RepID=A0A8J6QGV4_9FLAO|nr:DUF1080 domain-containing protein [Aestuariibaculum suncheonense]MBD0836285.1 DUF1080 domain-containing protein [Aestuariibaculum suncheonense]